MRLEDGCGDFNIVEESVIMFLYLQQPIMHCVHPAQVGTCHWLASPTLASSTLGHPKTVLLFPVLLASLWRAYANVFEGKKTTGDQKKNLSFIY